MTYEKFCVACDRYHKMEAFTDKLYDMGLLADNSPLDDFTLDYAEAICDNFGADVGWFLNWIHDEFLNGYGVGEYKGTHIRIDGREEMYHFLCTDEAKECWL